MWSHRAMYGGHQGSRKPAGRRQLYIDRLPITHVVWYHFRRFVRPTCVDANFNNSTTIFNTHSHNINHSLATLGQSAKSFGSGRSRSHAHFCCKSCGNEPLSICRTYFPITGKNFQPWKFPQVATYKPCAPECGEMMKSPDVVKASLWCILEKELRWTCFYLPANPILIHLPIRTLLAIKDMIRMINVLLEPFRDLPLCVV